MPARGLQEAQEANQMNYPSFVAIAAVHGSILLILCPQKSRAPREGLVPRPQVAFTCCQTGLPRALNVFCLRDGR